MKEKNVLLLSGASTKIPFLGGATKHLCVDKNIKFSSIVGVSSGSILSLPIAMGLFDEMEKVMLEFKITDIFREDPASMKGIILSVKRVFSGEIHTYDQTKLLDILSSIITRERFRTWQNQHNSTDCYVGAVCIETGERRFQNLKKCTHSVALQWILASSSIPVFTKYVELEGKSWYDGGIRDHIGLEWLKQKVEQGEKIDNVYTIFSRPEDLSSVRYAIPKKKIFGTVALVFWALLTIIPDLFILQGLVSLVMLFLAAKSINIISLLMRVIDIMNWEISKTDEKLGDSLKDEDIVIHKIFAPHKLAGSTYETSNELSKKLFDLGVDAAKNS